MDAVVCKTSNEEIQDGILKMSTQSEGIMSSPRMNLPNRKSEILEKYSMEEKLSQSMNGCISQNAHKFDNSPDLSNNLSQKSLSPTLIEHAFQVVKNIFSPEKNKNKSPKILSSTPQNQILSGSPCSSVYIQSLGRESIASEYELSNSERIPRAIEISSKVDNLCEWGSTPSSFSQESYNSSVADESFLTTVSRIEDSFQSAVTHMDENSRDSMKKDSDQSSAYLFGNSQNSSLLLYPSNNNTLSDSECDLGNTVIRNDDSTVENKTIEISDSAHDEDVSNCVKNVTFTIEKNDEREEVVFESTIESGESCKKADGDIESVSGEINLELSDNKSLSLVEGKKMEKSERGNSALDDNEKITCENPAEDVAMMEEDVLSNETTEKNESEVKIDGDGDSDNLITENSNEAEHFPERETEGTDVAGDVKGSVHSVEASSVSGTEVSEEAENETDSNISTTTIVLADSHSESDNGSSTSKPDVRLEKNASAPSLEESESSQKNFSLTNLRKSCGGGGSVDEKQLSRRGGNKAVKGNGSKLNKSFDFVDRKKLYTSPEDFRQKLTEEFVLNSAEEEREEDSMDYFPQESMENRKFPETQCEVNERGDKMNSPLEMSSSNSSCCFLLDDAISLSSQQSYTILSNSNNNLKRPVIESFEEFSGDWQPSNSQSSATATASEDLEIRKTYSDFTNKWSNLSSETVNFVSSPKQSTSVTNSTKTFSIRESDLFNSKRLQHFGREIFEGEEQFKKMNDSSKFSSEKENEFVLNGGLSNKMDSIYPGEFVVDHPESNLSMVDDQTEPKNSNETFEVKQHDGSIKLNRILEVESKTPTSSKIKINQSFEKVNGEKEQRIFGVKGKLILPETEAEKEEEKGKKKQMDEFVESKSFSAMIIETKFSDSDFAGESSEKSSDKEGTNSSFISTTSSNTSLLCNGNVTVLLADRGGSAEEKESPDEFLGLGEEFPDRDSTNPSSARENEEWIDARSSPFSPMEMAKEDEKDDLVQYIEEQFTTTEIEKICSVVEDFSGRGKNPALPVPGAKEPEVNPNGETFSSDKNSHRAMMTPWSPHSLDFLNSIGGKATGRDLSRESLYVKFDPLVSAQIANSLIDFTKEAEPVPVEETSTESSESVVEQLLAISPEKKSEEIVPPLTPLSQKSKNQSKEDKMERVKQLQNEIYFLKNLYAERERTNRGKIESYEGQIARLTGQNCVLEEKLKESNEREKSLVKKLQEQNQSITQLKTIVDEYAKVITKLTSEWENMKNENQKQFVSLNMEKNSYMTHLQNTEAAFTDVHAKYEKSKKTIVNLKTNEAMFRNTIAEQSQTIEEYKEKTREIQERAQKEFDRIQEELAKSKSVHVQETARLKAQLRKTELKLEAVQESLDQKIKENQQLTVICDELIEGKK